VADALEHAKDVFTYMGRLKEQSVFNFCAIPQVMAIATLALCYNNKELFARNVKIRKGQAVQLMMQANTMSELYLIFEKYALEIQAKARLVSQLHDVLALDSVIYWLLDVLARVTALLYLVVLTVLW
jgi:farnesyl-diphosphate farnesyltransferase